MKLDLVTRALMMMMMKMMWGKIVMMSSGTLAKVIRFSVFSPGHLVDY